ncbi:MAG: cytidine deaminase, partial [Marinilabiliales bacterium]
EYDNQKELDADDIKLIERAREAAKRAYAPYSKFSVGAALLLENGKIIEGNNQENAAYPSGLCAERVAMFYANSRYPETPIVAMAITAHSKGGFIKEPVPPCGSCRQVLMETENRFNSPIRVILAGSKKIAVLENVKSLLPLNFDNDFITGSNP